MEDQEQRKKRKSTLGYIHWLSLKKTWSLSMLDPLKEAIICILQYYFINEL